MSMRFCTKLEMFLKSYKCDVILFLFVFLDPSVHVECDDVEEKPQPQSATTQ